MGCWTFLIHTQAQRKYPPNLMGEQASERAGQERQRGLEESYSPVASAAGPKATLHVCEGLMRIELVDARSGQAVFVTMGTEESAGLVRLVFD